MKKCNLRPLYIKKYSKLPKNGQKRVKFDENTAFLCKIEQNPTKIDDATSTKNNWFCWKTTKNNQFWWKNTQNCTKLSKKHWFWAIIGRNWLKLVENEKQLIFDQFEPILTKITPNWVKFDWNWVKNTQKQPKMTNFEEKTPQKSAFHDAYTSKKCWKRTKKKAIWCNFNQKQPKRRQFGWKERKK